MDRIALLRNPVQKYGWGSRTFIQRFLGGPIPVGHPVAELWMGTHPQGPSEVWWEGQWTLLSRLIDKTPEKILGSGPARRFRNQLPFLFKVLAAAKPLSIQCHPNQKQAAEGFRREESRGTKASAPERNYRDRNHKPEMFCALKPSWVLRGFRDPMEIQSLMKKLRLSALSDDIPSAPGGSGRKGLQPFFNAIIELDPARRRKLISETLRAINRAPVAEPAFSWVRRLHRIFPEEAMVLSPLFMNLLHLEPGDAVTIHSGTLHSYLSGAGVEIMANSDNVVRAGLTSKRKDIGELLRIVNFHQEDAKILEAENRGGAEWCYPTEAKEFTLSVIAVKKEAPYTSPRTRSLEILLCVGGRARIRELRKGEPLTLTRGVSIAVPASVEQYTIAGRATIYKAAVPPE